MEKFILLSIFLINILSLPNLGISISYCFGPCQTLNDCYGQLICINGQCNDDPDLGTSICLSSCNGPCQTWDNCAGQLICINGRCNDDPALGTNICPKSPPPPPPSIITKRPPPPPPIVTKRPPPPPPIVTKRPPPPPPIVTKRPPPPIPIGTCQPFGTLTCSSGSYPKYDCSPPVTTSTRAKLTLNDFSPGGDGGAPSECDEQYHSNTESIVALSTGWYAGGSRCLKWIRITAANGRSTTAKVVDECDSRNGCDLEHAYLPPCKNNIVDGSLAVWQALGLNTDLGIVDVTWSMV